MTFTPTDATNYNTVPKTVQINVLAPSVTLSTTNLGFGQQQLGVTSAAQTVALSNTGTAPLNITSIFATGDFAQSNNCGSTLQAGANCSISATFKPTALGQRAGAITIADNNNGVSGSTQTITLGGAGIAFSPNLLNSAVYATGTGCDAIKISGNAYTDSCDSSRATITRQNSPQRGTLGLLETSISADPQRLTGRFRPWIQLLENARTAHPGLAFRATPM